MLRLKGHQILKKPNSSSKTSWNKRWNIRRMPDGSKNKSMNLKS